MRSCLLIEAFLTRHLRLPRWTRQGYTTKEIDVSHRHDPTKGDAPYKSFEKNDWIPTDVVSRAWPASWNKFKRVCSYLRPINPFIILRYYDDAFDSCAFLHALPSTWCMYINYRRISYNTYVLHTSLHSPSVVTFFRPVSSTFKAPKSTQLLPSASTVQYQASTLISKKLPLSSVALKFPLSFDWHVFLSQNVSRKSVIPCNSTYIW